MCGRFTLAVTDQAFIQYIGDQFELSLQGKKYALPRYNVSPGQEVVAMIHDGLDYRVGNLHWGFIPPDSTNEKSSFTMINARSETILEKKTFLPSFRQKRCVIFADGFFEWNRFETGKTPFRILQTNHQIFPIAGLYTSFTRADGTKIHSTVILTTKANQLMSNLHDRMPVILDPKDVYTWLNPNNHDTYQLKSLLKPLDSNQLEYYPVSNIVNSSKIDTIECIQKK